MNEHALFLCVVFVGWSALGWWIGKSEDWLNYLVNNFGVWPLLGYFFSHLALAMLILKKAGLRLWSGILCVLGLVIGQWVNVQVMIVVLIVYFFGIRLN